LTVHDFTIIYNETFKYIDQKYGSGEVKDLWNEISKRWCVHLNELVGEKGLQGMYEYWGGENGTISREKAECTVTLKDGMFTATMAKCPSVTELEENGREIYSGNLSYCDHCLCLYGPVVKKYGFSMTWSIDSNHGKCTGKCKWTSFKEDQESKQL
jgi:hypothetical protein